MANKLGSKEIQSLISMYSSELNKLRFQSQLTRNTIIELKADLKEVLAAEAAAEAAKLAEVGTPEPAATPKRRGRRKGTKAKGRRGRPRKTAAKAAAPETTTEKAEATPTPAPAKRRGRPKGSTSAKTKTKAKAKPTEKAAPAKRGRKPGPTGGYKLSEYDNLVIESLEQKGKVLIASEMQDYIEDKFKAEGRKVSADEVKLRVTRSLQKLANRRDDLKKVRYEGRGFAYAHPKWINPAGAVKKKYQRK